METKSKLGQEPAFPIEYGEYNSTGLLCKRQDFGISKRLYIATFALQGFIAGRSPHVELKHIDKSLIVKYAFEYADEMLKQEQDGTEI
jgi:hypothetical protein